MMQRGLHQEVRSPRRGVANAVFQHVAPSNEFPKDKWDALVSLLLTSLFLLAKYSWPHLRDSERGRFIAIASTHALVASPFKIGYVSAKHGVLGLVKALALEGAEHGIASVAFALALFASSWSSAKSSPGQGAQPPEERVLNNGIPAPHAIRRLIEPEEVAAAVAMLLGPRGSCSPARLFTMDLGWTAR